MNEQGEEMPNRISVELLSGGTITLSVAVNPISLRGLDRTFFYNIVDAFADYQAKVADEIAADPAVEVGDG